MIVLDTNVISELFRPNPNSGVIDWLESQFADVVFTTAVTRGELFYGLNIMPEGGRRQTLLSGVQRIFEVRFAGRVLPYDEASADAFAQIAAQRRAQGRSSSQSNQMIAGIVRSRGATLATRNSKDFEDCGIALIDPWH